MIGALSAHPLSDVGGGPVAATGGPPITGGRHVLRPARAAVMRPRRVRTAL